MTSRDPRLIADRASGMRDASTDAMRAPRKPRVLVVYYSRTGNTEGVARRLAELADATLEALQPLPAPRRRGLFGLLVAGYEAVRGRPTRIAAPRFDPRDFDLVLIGSPTWSSSLSDPVRAYLRQFAASLPAVGFFVTYGGRGAAVVLEQMGELSGKAPLGTLTLLESELKTRALLRTAGFWRQVSAKLEQLNGTRSLRLLPGGLASTP